VHDIAPQSLRVLVVKLAQELRVILRHEHLHQ
jgi:hypothetical protein